MAFLASGINVAGELVKSNRTFKFCPSYIDLDDTSCDSSLSVKDIQKVVIGPDSIFWRSGNANSFYWTITGDRQHSRLPMPFINLCSDLNCTLLYTVGISEGKINKFEKQGLIPIHKTIEGLLTSDCQNCDTSKNYSGQLENALSSHFISVNLLDNGDIVGLDEDGHVWQQTVREVPREENASVVTHMHYIFGPVNKGIAVEEISVGLQHCLLRTKHGEVYSWGDGMRGQLGIAELSRRDLPVLVEALHGMHIKAIAAGGWHCLAIGSCNEVYVWGWNSHGQLGLKCKQTASVDLCFWQHNKFQRSISASLCCDECKCKEWLSKWPGKLKNLASAVKKFSDHLGPSLTTSGEDEEAFVNVQSSPVMLQEFGNDDSENDDVVEVAAGERHSLFLLANGEVWSCGWNKYGQCGICCRKESYDDDRVTQGALNRVVLPGPAIKIWARGFNSVYKLK